MRVTLIAPSYQPEFAGGTEVVVRAQAHALARRGHRVRVIAGSGRPIQRFDLPREQDGEVEVAWLPRSLAEPADLELRNARVAALIERETREAELVHLHHWRGLSSDLLQRLSRERPVVATLHDFHAFCARGFRVPPDPEVACPTGKRLDACVRCVGGELDVPTDELTEALYERRRDFLRELAAADRVVVPSEFLRHQVLQLVRIDDERLRVVPHGLCSELAPAERAPRAEGAPLRLLHFGNRCAVKGSFDLVEALVQLPGGAARLTMAGAEVEPGHDAHLRARAGALEVELRGVYEAGDLPELAAHSDLALFPSRAHESYGLVVDEALALGLPVWVSDRGALPERVERKGRRLPGARVLPAERPAVWARALAELVARGGGGQDARPAPLRTADEAAAELEELYLEALARPKLQAS